MVYTVATFNSIKVRHQGGFPGPPWSPSSCPAPVFSKALVLVRCVSCSSCHSPGSKGVLVTVTLRGAAGAMISSPSSAGALLGGLGVRGACYLEGSEGLA